MKLYTGSAWVAAYVSGSGYLASANNLSDVASASTARTNLGLAIGTNVQAWDADLDTWATKTAPSGTVVGTSDTQTLTNKTLTAPTIASANLTTALTVTGAAGTSGQVLTSGGSGAAPTWASPSSGAMVFVTSATASNSSTLDIENAMTAYGMYVIVATGLNMSNTGYLQCQLKIGGSYQTTNNYYWVTNRGMSPASASTGSGIDFIRFGEGNSLPSNTSYGMMLTMYLPNPSSSQYKTTSSVLSGFDANLTNVDFYNAVGGFRGSTSALTGVRFFCNNARTFNGVFRLYGIANS